MTTGETDLVTGNLGTGPVGQRGIRDQLQSMCMRSPATQPQEKQNRTQKKKGRREDSRRVLITHAVIHSTEGRASSVSNLSGRGGGGDHYQRTSQQVMNKLNSGASSGQRHRDG